MVQPLLEIILPLQELSKGKVRHTFVVGGNLLFVASDRLSAFDVVLSDGIPDKGMVLTQLTALWCGKVLPEVLPRLRTHFVTADFKLFPSELQPYRPRLEGRSMLVRRRKIFPIECVVRGYLSGSGWAEYKERGSVCGVKLPKGLVESDRLPEPIFTPTTKATAGHDEPLTFDQVVEIVGMARALELRENSIAVYETGARFARRRGIIIADTKFEWGIPEGASVDDPAAAPAELCDEVLTPDSSRFWPQDQYKPGGPQSSFDKQFVRDYLLSLKWDKRPPAPKLPRDVIEGTTQRYLEALSILSAA